MNAVSDGNEARMNALSEALARLVVRQQEIERRLAAIESKLEIPRQAQAVSRQVPPPVPEAGPPSPVPSEASPGSTETAPLESRMGMVWVNRAGVITLVLGVAFFFKYAVDNRWIGERGRVALGIAAGLAALALAERFWRRGQATFAQGICGTGIAILYVSFYAAYGFYSVVPQGAAFASMALNTVAAGWLALRYGSAAIAALGLTGGYLTPLVLSSGADRPWAFLSYVLLLSAGGMAFARLRNWRSLETLAFIAATILYWFWVSEFDKDNKAAATIFALAFYALFAMARLPAVAGFNQVAAVIALLVVSMPGVVPGLPLAVLVMAYGLASGARRGWPAMALISAAAFWAPYAVAHFQLKEHNPHELIFVFLTLAFLAPAGLTLWRAQFGTGPRSPAGTAVLSAACYFSAGYDLLDPRYRAWMGLFACVLALAHLGLARELRRHAHDSGLYEGIALCFTTLAIPIQFAGYRITMGWALEGAALIWIARRSRERRLVWVSLAVFALAVLRLLAVDSWMYANSAGYAIFWNGRFLTFATAAIALWLAAYWNEAGLPALALYIAGHFVLLWGLGLEILAWAERLAPAPDIANLQSASISILLAAYAVLLVALGVTKRSALNRILGLGLIAAVVVKLYVYDVWQMSRGMYRVTAFAGLGLFLLLTSYLYSRYRSSIEDWWRGDRRH